MRRARNVLFFTGPREKSAWKIARFVDSEVLLIVTCFYMLTKVPILPHTGARARTHTHTHIAAMAAAGGRRGGRCYWVAKQLATRELFPERDNRLVFWRHLQVLIWSLPPPPFRGAAFKEATWEKGLKACG